MTPDIKYLVIGSDGLFDVLPNKTIARRATLTLTLTFTPTLTLTKP